MHLRKKLYFVHIPSEILILYKCLISFRSLLSISFHHNLRRKEFKFLQIYCFLPKKEAQKLVFAHFDNFRRIFRDRPQFTDQRRQNSHLLLAPPCFWLRRLFENAVSRYIIELCGLCPLGYALLLKPEVILQCSHCDVRSTSRAREYSTSQLFILWPVRRAFRR